MQWVKQSIRKAADELAEEVEDGKLVGSMFLNPMQENLPSTEERRNEFAQI